MGAGAFPGIHVGVPPLCQGCVTGRNLQHLLVFTEQLELPQPHLFLHKKENVATSCCGNGARAVSLWARGLRASSVTVGPGTLLELDAAGCPGCSCTHCSACCGLWPDPEVVAWGSTCVAPLPCASWRAAGSSQDLPPEHHLLVAAGTVCRDTQLGLCLA